MSIITELKTKLSRRQERYVCRFCQLSFEHPRTNCPACGCGHVD